MMINKLNSLVLEPGLPPNKVIVLLSGGLDSATCLAMVRKYLPLAEVHAMFFEYGQAHLDAEKSKSVKLAELHKAEFHVVQLPPLAGSALTDGSPVATIEGTSVAPTFVPGRNMIFAAHAAAFAEVIGAQLIVTGVNNVDYSGYPDCRPTFVAHMQEVIRFALPSGADKNQPIRYAAPLLYMSKVDIVKTAKNLDVDLEMTHSCYFPKEDGTPCHTCDSCKIRDKAIAEVEGTHEVTQA